MKSFIEMINQLEHQLDNVVNVGSDDELFIASYLQGHVSVVAKPMEIHEHASAFLLDQAIKANLAVAFANNELELEDQTKVNDMWHELISPYLS